ncbi:hypothetical protein M426DRAFT_18986 [Hypoxylon sp. CI-4A]|nr:hypothetical protein M426DRAFT_18986 [Hypoxylon sp. CI-4A]
MSKNGDIRGFFGGQTAGHSSSSSQSQATSSSLQPVQDLPPIPSSPRTPPKSTSKPRDRTDEIKGSDEEEDDSDDSLASVSVFFKSKTGPAPYQRDPNLTSTPRAKRIASSASTIKSPLTVRTKHKFDLKFLVAHAKQSNRAEESARVADELINQGDDDDDDANQFLKDVQNDPALLQKTAKTLLKDGEDDTKGDKLVRAIHRTKAHSYHNVHYFFNLEQPVIKPLRKPFPQKGARGCWSCLANSRARNQVFISGLPHVIASKGKTLPDEIFLWILGEICVEKNAQLRVQYCNLIALCPDSVSRLVTDARLYSMLEKLGGPKYLKSEVHPKLKGRTTLEDPYPGRDWTGLAAFLELLERLAPMLNTQNAIGAILLLLRMALDPLVSTTVRAEHAAAMIALVGVLPSTGTKQWDEACEVISSYLYEVIDEPINQVVPISHMPNTTPQLVDLRRRMAAVALFQDADLGKRPIDKSLSFKDVMERPDSPDFKINASTDFEELRALVTLLDLVVGSAGFIRDEHAKDEDGARKFDVDIDTLTFRMKLMHDKIHDSTQSDRKVAKLSIDLLARRLNYLVRTKPPPKTSIFDPEPKEDTNLPKQRAFMEKFTSKKWNVAANGNGSTNGVGTK